MATATKQKILTAARRLLNQKGSRAVTTNHIAEACGISPGNLYYHYKNKEDIISALFAKKTELVDTYWAREIPVSREGLREIPYMLQFLTWDFRFFDLELNTLLSADEKLRKAYSTARAKQNERLSAYTQELESAGVIRKLADNERHDFVKLFMLVTDHWLADLKASGVKLSRRELHNGVLLLDRIFENYYLN